MPLRFDPGLTLGRTGYRGSLHVSGGPGSLAAANVVPLERYLRAVVPSEEPFYWNPQALAAQAVAARTYASQT